jgi:hypothetical protein
MGHHVQGAHVTCVCDNGTLDFATSEMRRARKSHRCEECRRFIFIGDHYMHHSAKWEGSICTHALCMGCHDWTRAFVDAAHAAKYDCDCWELGCFWTEAVPEFCREVLRYNPETGGAI